MLRGRRFYAVELLENRRLMAGDVFNSMTADYLGKFDFPDRIAVYDLFPEAFAEDGQATISWLGLQSPDDPDPTEIGELAGDRIYQNKTSLRGNGEGLALNGSASSWVGKPKPVYGGLAGSTGQFETDDHLVGSPTTIKVGDTYVRYIESYGNWVTKINRFFSIDRGDNWVTHGSTLPTGLLADQVNSYALEVGRTEQLGFAPRYPRAGTHPIYSGELTGHDGHRNRFLSLDQVEPRDDASGSWSALNNGEPVFHLFDSPGPGRKALFNYFDVNNSNTYTTAQDDGERVLGAIPDNVQAGLHNQPGLLGYAIADLEDSPDSLGALQNRVRMLTSSDGETWTPFHGAATDGAMVAPLAERTAKWRRPEQVESSQEMTAGRNDPLRYDPYRDYGSGFPMALIRDGYLELYFTDDTEQYPDRGEYVGVHPIMWRIRIPETDIFNPSAYVNATRERTPHPNGNLIAPGIGFGFNDLKWSPTHQRYFGYGFSTEGQPEIWISEENPPPENPPKFAGGEVVRIEMPAGLKAGSGSILGDLRGHTLDCGRNLIQHANVAAAVCESSPHTSIHVIHDVYPEGKINVFERDLAHSLVIGYFEPKPMLPGDIDSNGNVEFADFLILSRNFGKLGESVQGDIDRNGSVEFADFLLLSANFGKQTATAAKQVPTKSDVEFNALAPDTSHANDANMEDSLVDAVFSSASLNDGWCLR